MRARLGIAVVSLVFLAASAAARDDPTARIDALAKRLTAPDPAVRERAEKDLAAAPPEDLRALVRVLRDRLTAAPPAVERDPFVEAEIPKQTVQAGDATRGLHFQIRLLALEPDVARRWLGCPTAASGAVVVPVPSENVQIGVRHIFQLWEPSKVPAGSYGES
jgi:hypothetical protein